MAQKVKIDGLAEAVMKELRDEQIKRSNDLADYISQQTALLTEFDEALVRL